MKKDLHPTDYRPVVFQDAAANFTFLTRSTAKSSETITWEDGNSYPLIKMHISSASHPFYTGQEKLLDTEGRVDRFASRLKAAEKLRASKTEHIAAKNVTESSAAKKPKAAKSSTKASAPK